MASAGPGGSRLSSDGGEFPDFDQLREKMNRKREEFFNDKPFFNGREPPFSSFRTRPGFEEFQQRSASPNFHSMGFPQDPFEEHSEPRKTSGMSNKDESIPIRVIHERQPQPQHHKYSGNHSKTADLPSAPQQMQTSTGSPRVTRAHSEPPKMFNQRLMKTKIPLGNVSENDKEESSNNNLSTSASDPSVPLHQRPVSPAAQQPQPPPRRGKQHEAAAADSPHQPHVRHIPIFVEGRDKPVINTPDQQQMKRPANVKLAAPKAAAQGEPTSPLSPIPSDVPIPMGYTEVDHHSDNIKETPIPLPCSPDPSTSQPKEETPQPQPQPPPQPQQTMEPQNDPCLGQLAKIQANVADLVKQIEQFSGNKDSKEYKFLDEMLTRNLLALDEIETGGRADVRQQRKESIRSINRCLSILESKASGVNNNDQAAKNNEILSELAK